MVSKDEIDKILAMCEKATADWKYQPGDCDCDWECGRKYGDPPCEKKIGECEHIKQTEPADVKGLFTIDCGDFMGLSNENAQYIAAACNAFPALAADYKAALGVVEAARELASFMWKKNDPGVFKELADALSALEGGR